MRAFFLFTVFFFAAGPAFPQQIIINELYNSGSTNEWIELVVVSDGLDLRGWDLRDFSSGGTPQDPLEFLSVPLWSSLEAGTIIVAARPDSLFPEDLDPSDFLLRVNTDNTDLFDGPLFVFAGSSDAIHIRDTTDQHVFGLSWGTNNAGSLPEPRVHFTESSTSNTAASFAGSSIGQSINPEHWLWDNLTPTPGAANGTLNSELIDSLRSITAFVPAENIGVPANSSLMQNYPNPFNGETVLRFLISDYGDVSLKVFDLLGRAVAVVVNEKLSPGTYTRHWNARGLSSGVYFYRLQSGGYTESRRLILVR